MSVSQYPLLERLTEISRHSKYVSLGMYRIQIVEIRPKLNLYASYTTLCTSSACRAISHDPIPPGYASKYLDISRLLTSSTAFRPGHMRDGFLLVK